MRIAFDLDGTLYDSLGVILSVTNHVRKELGYQAVTSEEYIAAFQSNDWMKLHEDLGMSAQDAKEFVRRYYIEYKYCPLPELIPNAKGIINRAKSDLGKENIYFVTQEPKSDVKRRFLRDQLIPFLSHVRAPLEGKTSVLKDLAMENIDVPLYYIGDIVSDGQACLEARKSGAVNLFFCGIIHPFAMNKRKAMESFVSQNSSFASIVLSLDELPKVWSKKV